MVYLEKIPSIASHSLLPFPAASSATTKHNAYNNKRITGAGMYYTFCTLHHVLKCETILTISCH